MTAEKEVLSITIYKSHNFGHFRLLENEEICIGAILRAAFVRNLHTSVLRSFPLTHTQGYDIIEA